MTIEKFESIIGDHCSPVLMGIKPSNLVSFSREEENVNELLELNAECLKKYDILSSIICSSKMRYQVLFYRPVMLESYLSEPCVRALLAEDGYSDTMTLSEKLALLKSRMECGDEFPHEIGLFLGYPAEDVEGFRKNRGAGCKFFGTWKVYGDVEEAKRLFALYACCRQFVSRQLSLGVSLRQIVRGRKEALNNIYNRVRRCVD